MKRSALVGVKVAVSLALLAYLFSTTDLRALEERVRTADLLDLLGRGPLLRPDARPRDLALAASC